MEDLEPNVKEMIAKEGVETRVYIAIEKIAKIIETIIISDGIDGWSRNLEGITSEDKEKLERSFKPLVVPILSIFKEFRNQKGGDISTDLKALPKPKSLENLSSLPGLENVDVNIDELYNDVVQKIEDVDTKTKIFSKTFPLGITKYVNSYDAQRDDPQPFRILGSIPPATPYIGIPAHAASKVKVPARTLVFFGYILMDTLRVILSSTYSNIPSVRKILSIGIAFVDILKGDWKSAILTLTGFFGEYPMLAGIVLKVMLQIYYYLSPSLRTSIVFGIKDVSKSLILGFMVTTFQTFAPAFIRNNVMLSLEQLRTQIGAVSDVLEGKQGIQKEAVVLPSMFDNINDLQSFVSDPMKVCSKEFKISVDSMKMSAILRLVLQLMNIPTEEQDMERKCGKLYEGYDNKNPHSYAEIVAITMKKPL